MACASGFLRGGGRHGGAVVLPQGRLPAAGVVQEGLLQESRCLGQDGGSGERSPRQAPHLVWLARVRLASLCVLGLSIGSWLFSLCLVNP